MVADNDAEDNALLDDKGEDVQSMDAQSMDALIDLSVDKIVDKNGYVEDKSFILSMLLFKLLFMSYIYIS